MGGQKGATAVLSEYEHTLFALYAKLSEERWLEPQERAIFRKIALDSFNHGIMLDELKDAVEPKIADKYEEIAKALNEVRAAKVRALEAASERSRERLFSMLEELERYESYAFSLYEKLLKEVKDELVGAVIGSIIEDEREHEELIKRLASRASP